jgi:hypothetical protein
MAVYAKLRGRIVYADNDVDEGHPELHLPVSSTRVVLGRSGAAGPAPPGFLGVSHSKSVSRSHCTIEWRAEDNTWSLTCASKNGLVVDRRFVGKGSVAPLAHRSAIKFGPCAFYFLLPGDGAAAAAAGAAAPPPLPAAAAAPPPAAAAAAAAAPPPPAAAAAAAPVVNHKSVNKLGKLTYAELVAAAFDAPDLARGDGVSSTEIRDWVLRTVDAWRGATPEQVKLLSTGIQGALYRGRHYAKADGPSRQNKWVRAPGAAGEPPRGAAAPRPPPARPAAVAPPGGPPLLPPGYLAQMAHYQQAQLAPQLGGGQQQLAWDPQYLAQLQQQQLLAQQQFQQQQQQLPPAQVQRAPPPPPQPRGPPGAP